MDKESYQCDVCNIEVPLNSRKEHEKGKKHKKNSDAPPTKLFVKGYPGYSLQEDLMRILSKFGPFSIEKFTRTYAIVKFDKEESSEAVIANQKDLFMYGSHLYIRYYEQHLVPTVENRQKDHKQHKREFVRSKRKEIIIEPQAIDLSGDFAKQCDAILAAIRLTREEVESISLLFSNLTDLFQSAWPGCVAVPFGSITTGLGIKTSDADCFIDIPEGLRHGGLYSYVPKAKNLMNRYPHIFAEVLAIPRANTPIVKFFHIPTDINCDVSFKTPLGARNSQLIAFLLRTDTRILYLCILIKYWAKVHGLTGTGKLSNYALTMLVIFYLQQQPYQLLHCIQFMQRGQNCFIDGWNTGFINQHHLLPHVNNQTSLSELLGGFFQYYKNFNFNDDVVCPYLGIPVQKVFFENIHNLSNAFDVYKTNVQNEHCFPLKVKSEMVVQDPFEQCHNITSCVGFKLYNEIIQTIEWASGLYEEDKKNNCENFLKNILLQKPKIKPVNSNPSFKVTVNPHVVKMLPPEKYSDLVEDAFVHIFKDILKFSVFKQEPKESSPPNKNKQKVSYLCKASKSVWKRKKFDDKDPDFLKRQISITKKVLKDGNPENVSMHIIVEIVSFKRDAKCHLVLKLENDVENKFGEFGNFCLGTIGQWFQKLLLTHVDDKSKNKIKDSELLSIPGVDIATTSANIGVESSNHDGNNQVGNPQISITNKASDNTDKPDSETVVNRTQECMVVETQSNIKTRTSVVGMSSNTVTKFVDMPKPKSDCTDSQHSSPDTNPPAKMQRKD